MRIALTTITVCAALFGATPQEGSAAKLPRAWSAQALCIHSHESTDWYATADWQGSPSIYHGGMQIDLRTWVAMAPPGFPADPAVATIAQQLAVSYRIWLANGRRFSGQWTNAAAACGVP